MAVNLNPGADATIASAAAKAGLAGVPKALSRTFQGMATGYSQAMGRMGAGIATAAKVAGAAAGDLIKDVKDGVSNMGLSPNVTDLVLKKELPGLVTKGLKIFGLKGEEKIAAKEEWKKQKERVFGAIKAFREGTFLNEEIIKSDMINTSATGVEKTMMQQSLTNGGNAIKKGMFKGVYTKMETDEDGDYVMRFYDKDNKAITGVDKQTGALKYEGKPLSISPSETKGLVVQRDDENIVGLNNIALASLSSGEKGGTFLEGSVRGDINKLLNSSNRIANAMHSELGREGAVYADVLSQPNKWTAGMYKSIANIEGVEDINNDGKITKADFTGKGAGDNMMRLREEMLNPDNQESKELFIDWYTDVIKDGHSFGKQKREAELRDKDKNKNKRILGLDVNRSYHTFNYDGETSYVKGEDIINTANTFKGIENKGQGSFTGYNGMTYEFDSNTGWKRSKWEENEDGEEVMSWENIPRNTVINDLKWSDKPDVLKHVGEGTEVSNDVATSSRLSNFQKDQIRGLFDSKANEGEARKGIIELLKETYPNLKDDLKESTPGFDRLKYDGNVYDLSDSEDAEKLINALEGKSNKNNATISNGVGAKYNKKEIK